MTDASLPAGRFSEGDLRVGDVLSRAWAVFSGNFLKFIAVTGLAALPSLLISNSSVSDAENLYLDTGLSLFAAFLTVALTVLSQAIVFYGAFQDMRGRPFSLADGLRVGLGRLFPLIGLAVVVGLAVIALLGACFLFVAPVLIFAGFIILVVMLLLMWSMGIPACVVERLGPFCSLARSRALTKGHRWKILGLLLLTLIIGAIVGAIVGAVMGTVLAHGPAGSFGAAATQTIGLIWDAIWTAFFAVVMVVTYHDLRVAREGVDTEQIAAVFE
jgi:MFS family permease